MSNLDGSRDEMTTERELPLAVAFPNPVWYRDDEPRAVSR